MTSSDLKVVNFLRAVERPELSPDFADQVFRKIRESGPIRASFPIGRVAVIAAVLILSITGLLLFYRSPARPDPVALASDHARRALLALREAANSEGRSPEEGRRDLALSGLEERTRQLTSLRAQELPPDVGSYLSDAVPRIERALQSGSRELARSFLENRDVAAMASRAGSLPGSPAAITKSGDEELDAYLAGRAALYAGDSGRAFVAFQQVLDRYPEGRLRAGASYWLARSAAASGRSRDAAVAYYAALGSLWLDSSDRAAIATLVTSLKEGPDEALESVIEARPPRGSGEVRVSLKNLLQYLEDGREAMPDSVTLRQQLVTILLQVDWTIIQGDLDPRVLQAFRRIQSFYPRDVEVKDREVRVRASAESKIRNDSALKNEAAVIRRALPLMWR